jgi:ribosomal protein S18 acetylase RimI-like enzyme
VYQLRSILNTDPPQIAEIWNLQPEQRGLIRHVSPWILERTIFARTYFDPQGFIVAEAGQKLVGFVHAGFGPSEDEGEISTELGVTCMLMIRPEYFDSPLAKELLSAGEAYLVGRGAKVLYAGGIRPLNPFYLGLYGGSDLPGVLETDQGHIALYRSSGYEEIDRVRVMQRRLETFRPRIDRTQMQLGRKMEVRVSYDPASPTWWEACLTCGLDRTRYELVARGGGRPLASATFWDMESFSASWSTRAMGLLDLDVDVESRRCGYARHLLGEAFTRMRDEGVEMVEAQTMISNTAAHQLYLSLGLDEIDQGVVLRRSEAVG